MTNEAIVLAGGFGTRLSHILGDIPKPMAPVNKLPFLQYVFDYLIENRITKAILSVGHLHEKIQDHFKNKYKSLSLEYAIEKEALGTGGGIQNALDKVENDHVFVINGDTYFDVSLKLFYSQHISHNSNISLALKPMEKYDRYGSVNINENNSITSFEEKKYTEAGLINGGISLLNSSYLTSLQLPDKFSFEKDVLEKHYNEHSYYGFPFDNYFIDIGIPEDYDRAQEEFKRFIN